MQVRTAVVALAILAVTSWCHAEEYLKLAPFTGVRWEGDEPLVKVDAEWLSLVSIDEIEAEDIVGFCKRTYGVKWQKRFEEDLVEVLSKMGHVPKDTVRLVVLPLESTTSKTLDDVAMTRENCQAIYAVANERVEQQPKPEPGATQPAVAIDDVERFRTRIDEFLSVAQMKTGFSGAMLVARDGQPVYQGAFGFSDLQSKQLNTLDTPFRILGQEPGYRNDYEYFKHVKKRHVGSPSVETTLL